MVGFSGGGGGKSSGRSVYSGALTSLVTLDTVAADYALGSVDVTLPAGVTVFRVIAGIQYSKKEDTSGSDNYIDGASNIQVLSPAEGASYTTGLSLPTQIMRITASTTDGANLIPGEQNLELSSVVTVDGNYLFQWTAVKALGSSYLFYDVQPHLIVEYTSS